MKRVILSEGKNDTVFLKELLTKKISIEESKILFFDQDTENDATKLKFLQDTYFEKLSSEWMPYDLLAKSEGGKAKIVAVTISRFCHLCEQGRDPIMLIDLDGGTMNTFIDKLEEKLTNRFRSFNLTVESRELHKIDDASMWSMTLFKNTKHIGTIYVIGFHETLERVTGIINGIHTHEQKRSMSKTYIERSRIHEMFIKALKK